MRRKGEETSGQSSRGEWTQQIELKLCATHFQMSTQENVRWEAERDTQTERERERERMRRVEADKDYADTEKQRRGTGGGGT